MAGGSPYAQGISAQYLAVVKVLEKFEVESNLKHIICSLLCDRMVVAEWGCAKRLIEEFRRVEYFPTALDLGGKRPT